MSSYHPSPVIFAIAILFSASAFMFALSLIPAKSDVTKRLEELEGLKWDQNTGGEREKALEKLFNEKQRSTLKSQLLEAGWYTVTPAKMAARIISGGCFGLTLGLGGAAYLNNWDYTVWLGVAVCVIAGLYYPLSRLKSAIARRKILIQRALPNLLDMLATTVKAGLAFNAALGYAEDATTGPLRDEIRAVLSEIRLGRSRAEALKSMAVRVKHQELTTAVTAIVQAERLGSDLSKVLEELAAESRNKRMSRAEEIAALMPIKMVIPMALFMLPALFVIIFGPVVAEYLARPQ
jgi:Flp pilus assembly protein TadB